MSVVPERGPDLQIDSLRVDGCRDATFGTRVELGGHLTVNQYLQVGEVTQPANLTAIKHLLVKDATRKFSLKNTLSLKIFILSVFLTSLVAGGTVGITLLIKYRNSNEDTIDDLPKDFTDRLRTYESWSDNETTPRDQDIKELLYRPALFVVVAHTAGSDCTTPCGCKALMRDKQLNHLKARYNFLIGGDGFIYEMLGWGRYGAPSPDIHTYGVSCASIEVAFVGNYQWKGLKERQRNAFWILLEEGVRLGELDPDYKIFAQSQVAGGQSPGLHILQEIADWNRYSVVQDKDLKCNLPSSGQKRCAEGREVSLTKLECSSSSHILVLSEILLSFQHITSAMMMAYNVGRNVDSSDTLPNNYTERLRTREFWSANEIKSESKELVYRPAKFVVVAHTAGGDCIKPLVCEAVIRGIQEWHLGRGYGDISYNFLIGGDGYIYEGVGWGRYGSHTYGVNCASVGVAFVGDYETKRLRDRERNAFRILLEEGVRLGELEPDYKMFAQSQITGGDSPGRHIKDEMVDWDHYAVIDKEDFICE